MKREIGRFLECRDAAALVEFSICALAVIMLLVGVIEFAMLNFSATLLEGGMREAARYGITGRDIDSTTRTARIVTIVNEHAGGLFQIDPGDVTTLVYPNFSDIGQSEPFTDVNGNGDFDPGEPFTDRNCNGDWDVDMGVAGLGAGGEVVLYTASRDIETITGLLDPFIAPDGAFTIRATIAVRNEPFRTGQGVCAP